MYVWFHFDLVDKPHPFRNGMGDVTLVIMYRRPWSQNKGHPQRVYFSIMTTDWTISCLLPCHLTKEINKWTWDIDLSWNNLVPLNLAWFFLPVVAFQLYDQDKDGKISRDELLKVTCFFIHVFSCFLTSWIRLTAGWSLTGSPGHAGDAGDRGAAGEHSRPYYTGSRSRPWWRNIFWGVS